MKVTENKNIREIYKFNGVNLPKELIHTNHDLVSRIDREGKKVGFYLASERNSYYELEEVHQGDYFLLHDGYVSIIEGSDFDKNYSTVEEELNDAD